MNPLYIKISERIVNHGQRISVNRTVLEESYLVVEVVGVCKRVIFETVKNPTDDDDNIPCS